MSWLDPTATSPADLLALHPGLAEAHDAVIEEIWNGQVDPRVLELCRVRSATLVGNRAVGVAPMSPAAAAAGLERDLVESLPSWPTDPRFDDRMRACLALTEQFVLDVHGITDDLVEQVSAHLGAEGVVTLTTALATWEITNRFDNALLGGTEAQRTATSRSEPSTGQEA